MEIKISKIIEEEFIFSADDVNDIVSKDIFMGVQLNFEPDVKNNLFSVRFGIIYNYQKSLEERVQMLKFTTLTKFKVKNFGKLIKIETTSDENFELPDSLMQTFVSTAISSTRGMLACKLAGTILADYYIPLIDVKEMLEKVGVVD